TSPITSGFIIIVVYYLLTSGELKFRLLTLPRLEGAYSGKNIAATILVTL
ncbi:hypothetical protein QBC39DRAFT_251398, partial [Podospora conica]